MLGAKYLHLRSYVNYVADDGNTDIKWNFFCHQK